MEFQTKPAAKWMNASDLSDVLFQLVQYFFGRDRDSKYLRVEQAARSAEIVRAPWHLESSATIRAFI